MTASRLAPAWRRRWKRGGAAGRGVVEVVASSTVVVSRDRRSAVRETDESGLVVDLSLRGLGLSSGRRPLISPFLSGPFR
jgi:hypothetical protein